MTKIKRHHRPKKKSKAPQENRSAETSHCVHCVAKPRRKRRKNRKRKQNPLPRNRTKQETSPLQQNAEHKKEKENTAVIRIKPDGYQQGGVAKKGVTHACYWPPDMQRQE